MKNMKKWQIVVMILEIVILVAVLVIAAFYLFPDLFSKGKDPVTSVDPGQADGSVTGETRIEIRTDEAGNEIKVVVDKDGNIVTYDQENEGAAEQDAMNPGNNENNAAEPQNHANGGKTNGQNDTDGNSSQADISGGSNASRDSNGAGNSEGESSANSDQGSMSTDPSSTEPAGMEINGGYEIDIPEGAGDAGM